MKKIILVFFCLTLTVAAGLAEDFHLVETTINGDTLVPYGKLATNSIYVLLLPIHNGAEVHINPVVLKTFDAKEIGQIIGFMVTHGFLSAGSVLHFDPSPVMEQPPAAQIKVLTDYCKKIGITVIVSSTA